MSYRPTPAGHEEAPTEQLVVREKNELLEQAVNEMLLQLTYRDKNPQWPHITSDFLNAQRLIGAYYSDLVYAAWNDPRVVKRKKSNEEHNQSVVLADFLARSPDTVIHWHDDAFLGHALFQKKVVVLESMYYETVGHGSSDTLFIIREKPLGNICVSGTRSVVINISDVKSRIRGCPHNNSLFIDAGAPHPVVAHLYGARMPNAKRSFTRYFQLTGGPVHIAASKKGFFLGNRYERDYYLQRKCVYTRSQVKKVGLEEYLQELVYYARNDPEGIPERYGPTPAIRIRRQIYDILRKHEKAQGGAR